MLMLKKAVSGVAVAVLAVFLFAGFVFAQSCGTPPSPPCPVGSPGTGGTQGSGIPRLTNPLRCDNFQCVAGSVISFLIPIAASLAGIMVLVGGYQMVLSGGSPEAVSRGKKTIIYAAVGFVVILLARSAVPLLRSMFGGG